MLRVDKSEVRPISVPFDEEEMDTFQPGMIAQLVSTGDGNFKARFPRSGETKGPFVIIDDVRGRPRVGPDIPLLKNEDTTLNTGKLTVWYGGENNYFSTDQIGAPMEKYLVGKDLYVSKEGYLIPNPGPWDNYMNYWYAGVCIAVDKDNQRICFRLNNNKMAVEDLLQMNQFSSKNFCKRGNLEERQNKMKIKDEVKVSVDMRNARLDIAGQQVSDSRTKPIEVDLLFRIRDDITPEQLVDIIEEIEEREDEISQALEVLLAFLEKVLPIDEIDRADEA